MKVNEIFVNQRKLNLLKEHYPQESIDKLKPYLKRILHNLDEERFIRRVKHHFREKKAHNIVDYSFRWGSTPEGSDYWYEIYKKLEKRG